MENFILINFERILRLTSFRTHKLLSSGSLYPIMAARCHVKNALELLLLELPTKQMCLFCEHSVTLHELTHALIMDPDIWDAVQREIASKCVQRMCCPALRRKNRNI